MFRVIYDLSLDMRNLKLNFHDETLLFPSPLSPDGGRPFITLDFDSGLTFIGRGRIVAALSNGGGDGGGGGAIELGGGESGIGIRWRVELALKETDAIVGVHWSLENEALIIATAGSFFIFIKRFLTKLSL